MTKIDIVSGFLGAGKTTLIKKLLKEALAGTKVVLIENEFGEIGIDGGFLKEAGIGESGIEVKEMNSGCICCSLVGDFGASLKEGADIDRAVRGRETFRCHEGSAGCGDGSGSWAEQRRGGGGCVEMQDVSEEFRRVFH